MLRLQDENISFSLFLYGDSTKSGLILQLPTQF